MFFWFLGTALAAVWYVFRDRDFDVRPLLLGAVVPLADVVTGGAWVLHTLLASLTVLAVVMGATVGRRVVRKRWLGVPIGMMLHLVFDGVWTNTHQFAWPLGGWSFEARMPEVARGGWSLAMEVGGILLLGWFWRSAQLGDPQRRRVVVAEGRWYRLLRLARVEHSGSC